MTCKQFSIRLSPDERARLRTLAARAGAGPLAPTETAVARACLVLGLAQLEATLGALKASQTTGDASPPAPDEEPVEAPAAPSPEAQP